MISMSPAVQMDLFGTKSALFEHYGNFYKRIDRTTHQPKPEPITEFQEALVLLYRVMNDRTFRFLDTQAQLPDGTRGPAVTVEFLEGSGPLEYVFAITPEVFKELTEARILTNFKRYGYTDDRKFRLDREQSLERLFVEINKYAREHPRVSPTE